MTSDDANAMRDDGRDALALIRAHVDGDDEAAKAIVMACDPGGVIGFLVAWQAAALTITKGEAGLRRWLDRMQHQDVIGAIVDGYDEAS